MDQSDVVFNRDHPRMCGDHIHHDTLFVKYLGSPPHVRGPPALYAYLCRGHRITPACAGTTMIHSISWHSSQDHPRMCGDHSNYWRLLWINGGSPPHVRGPRNRPATTATGRGITPACAGTTPDEEIKSLIERDHPRMCGDHY